MVATLGTATTLGYRIYSGSCGTLTQVGSCTTGFGSTGSGSTWITGLTAGNSYFLQLFTGGSTNSATFNFCLQEFPAAPSNDECAGATTLTQSSTCNIVSSSTGGATQSQAATPCTGTPDDDVWFSFVATATDAQITTSNITPIVGTSVTLYLQVFSGTCAGLTSLACSTTGSAIVGGLTVGQTYYARAYTSLTTSQVNFDICVTSFATAPVCGTLSSPADAAQVTLTPTLSWSSVPNASGYQIYLGTTNPPVLYATTTNTATTYTVTTPLSNGTYYWYVVPYNSVGAAIGCQSTIRSFTAIAPPVNDDCASATVLVAATSNTCTGTAGTTVGATPSTGTAPTCSATGINDDVWYSFVATSTSHTVLITGETSTIAAQIYSGSCGALVALACASTQSPVTGLTIGNTYYVRVYTTVSTVTTNSVFNICLVTPPANNECAGALTMPVTAFNNTCNPTLVNTAGATISTTTGQANACTTTGIDDDVWYTFTTTTAGVYFFSYTDLTALIGTAASVGLHVYTGSCGALTTVGTAYCSSGFGSGGSGTLNLSLAAATTYTLRIWVGSSTNSGSFNFCITAPAPPPANDECSAAISLTPVTTATCATPVAGTTVGATQSTETATTCSATGTNDDVWYSFVATSTAHTVQISNTTGSTTASLYSGSCGGLTLISCGALNGAASGGLTIGQTYYVRVYTTATTAAFADFDICVVSGAPVNDNCSGAVSLPVSSNTTCASPTAGSTVGATPSPEPAPSCSATGANDDVWYSFVATATSHTVYLSSTSGTTAMAVYSGPCGSAQIAGACGSGADGSANATGLVIGNTYFVRVWSTSTTIGTTVNFNICVVSSPANDECATSISLPVSSTNSCATPTPGTTLGSTASAGAPAPSCSATGINDDVWYSFVATSTTHAVVITNETSTTAAQVYSGTCGTLALVANSCGSGGYVSASGLTIGQTYTVRVYSTSATAGIYSNFDICVITAPANDDCSNAQALTPSSTNVCSSPVAGSTLGATQSTGTAPTCSATGINDDVWYSFVATSAIHTVSLLNTTSASAAQVYSSTCGTLATVACGTEYVVASGLTPGNTYLVRVYTTSTTVGTYSDFQICIGTTPANDNCSGAISLTASTTPSCTPVLGSTVGATASTGVSVPTCSGTGVNDDVWYSFVATSTSHQVVISNPSNTTAAAVYSGTCGALIEEACASTNTPVTGLTIGATYYVRVYSTVSTSTTYTDFGICIIAPPSNDNCAGATTLTSGVTVQGTTVGATQTIAPEICTGSSPTAGAVDVWYSFTATQNGTATVTLTNVGATLDAVLVAYSGSCGSLTSIGCADGPGLGGSETLILNGLVGGTTYYLRVFNYTTGIGAFEITISGAAVPVTIEYFRGMKQAGRNLLDWKVNCFGSPSVQMEIERSADGRRFSTIQTMNESATRCLQPFSMIDPSPLPGINYYRLKTTDVDGKIAYSTIVAVINGDKGFDIVSMAPNPARTSAVISLTSAQPGKAELIVSDISGRRLSQQSISLIAGNNPIPLDVSSLASGVYQVIVTTANGDKKAIRFIRE